MTRKEIEQRAEAIIARDWSTGQKDFYAKYVAPTLVRMGREDVSPSAICELMRNQYGTLSHLDQATFTRETKIGVAVLDELKTLGYA